ncbi:hypothetical protein D7V95_10675 [bacterium J10(2018)]|nr:hypothetical protein D7V95_10675 [bacterium J10(2018)]
MRLAGAFTGSAGAETQVPETAPSDDGLSPANIWQESLSDSADIPVTQQTERGQCGREPDSAGVPVTRQTERGQCGREPDSADVPVTRQTERGQCGREPDSADIPAPQQTTERGSGLGD